MPARMQAVAAGALVTIWLLAWAEARADWRRFLAEWSAQGGADPQERIDAWFSAAQRSYLAGDSVAAEKTIQQILKLDAADVEARLLLATMWRRQGRCNEAGQQLDRLQKLEAAAAWQREIEQERVQIAAIQQPQNSPSESEPPPPTTNDNPVKDNLVNHNPVAAHEATPTTADLNNPHGILRREDGRPAEPAESDATRRMAA